MKRLFYCAALMLLSSSAYANSYSFVVGGHFIRIDASRYCYSRSCISVSTQGIRQTRHTRDRYDEADTTSDKTPAKVSTPPAAPPAAKPAVEPVASAPPAPTIVTPAAPASPPVAASKLTSTPPPPEAIQPPAT